MATLDREDRRLRRRPVSEHEQDVRMRDIGFLLGLLGLGAMAFVVGRSTSPGASCCTDLQRRDVELIRCEMQRADGS